jgi:integrase
MAIRMTVFRPEGRPYFVAQWVDLTTGKKKTRSTKTNIRRTAERFAGNLAKQLESGAVEFTSRITWADFRKRYELECLAHLSEGTRTQYGCAMDCFEGKVGPTLLRSITKATIANYRHKLAESELAVPTIKSRLGMLRAVLSWAKEVELIADVPKFKMPKGGDVAGGRAITGEEFDRLVAAARVDLGESWVPLLQGLWWSGLRIREALSLRWAGGPHYIDLSGRRPMFWIDASLNKAKRNERFPMAPEFFAFLQQAPEAERHGFVFDPMMRNAGNRRPTLSTAIRALADLGEAAGIKVRDDDGVPVFASAHDLRRSFGFRWSKRVMPPILQRLMRHRDIHTTLTFYAQATDDEVGDAVWAANWSASANDPANDAARVTAFQQDNAVPAKSEI